MHECKGGVESRNSPSYDPQQTPNRSKTNTSPARCRAAKRKYLSLSVLREAVVAFILVCSQRILSNLKARQNITAPVSRQRRPRGFIHVAPCTPADVAASIDDVTAAAAVRGAGRGRLAVAAREEAIPYQLRCPLYRWPLARRRGVRAYSTIRGGAACSCETVDEGLGSTSPGTQHHGNMISIRVDHGAVLGSSSTSDFKREEHRTGRQARFNARLVSKRRQNGDVFECWRKRSTIEA